MRHYGNRLHIVGYTHISGDFFGHILRVNGKKVQYIPVPHVCVKLYKTLRNIVSSVG